MKSYSSAEACAMSHLSYRRLDYWARAGAVTPSVAEADGIGTRRGWSPDDVSRLIAIAEVCGDLDELGMDISIDLVALLWGRLVDKLAATVCQGTLTVSTSRPSA